MSAPGSMPSPADYMSSASSSAIGAATKVTYKKGVVTHVEGVDKLTVDQNHIVDIHGNASRNIQGVLTETVLGEMNLYSPSKITIKSDTQVNVDTPWAVETKWTAVGCSAFTASMVGFSTGITTTKLESNSVNVVWNNGIKFKVGRFQSSNYALAFKNAVLTSFI
jgi:type VI secretion system secreted protein VgrG